MAALFSDDFYLPAFYGLFIAVTLFQMVFIASVLSFFYGRKGRDSISEAAVSAPYQGVSIIICARNEATNIRNNLPKMLAQQYPGPWELILVDDASEDETSTILLDFQHSNPQLCCYTIPQKIHPGKKQALAFGIASAKYELILVSDADCAPASPYWLKHMAAALNTNPNTDIVLGYGPMRTTASGSFLEKWTRFETAFTALQYCSFTGIGLPYMGVGRNLAFRKSVYTQAGGFATHEHLLSGDDDLLVNAAANARNTTCCLHADAFVYSASQKTWKAWVRQKKRHLSASSEYKWYHQALLGMLSLSHSLHFFLLILLLLLGYGISTTLYLWLLRTLILFIMYRKVFSKLREHDLLSLFPIYDALLAVYYGALIPRILIVNKTRSWN